MRGLALLLVFVSSFFYPAALLSADDVPLGFQPWQIVETKTGHVVTFDDLLTQVNGADVVYLGEEHRNAAHIESAIKVLHGLVARHRRPIVAMEMFGWDGQTTLDRYLNDPKMSKENFMHDARWKENWGGDYSDYAPLVNLARDRGLPLLALNPPRPLVRRVAKEGLANVKDDSDMTRWGMRDEVLYEDGAYHDIILKQLRSCHTGLADEAYQRIYQASVFRDEGMAKTISQALHRLSEGGGPIVSYTGGGHIQYGLPVPNRVARKERRPVRQITVYLQGFDPTRTEEIHALLREGIADYVWLTPLSTHGPSGRCL
ncbi:MAG: hypothetical protein E6K60_09580 [Nitrospirae bacterium]|nr:MAG: hypothetical protein E6K60_09580 [Nitrospirota bacterium]